MAGRDEAAGEPRRDDEHGVAVAIARRARERNRAGRHGDLGCERQVSAAEKDVGQLAAPLGGECWKTSQVMVPHVLRDRDFRDVITGAEIRPTRAGENAWIFLGEAFQTLPVAILRAL